MPSVPARHARGRIEGDTDWQWPIECKRFRSVTMYLRNICTVVENRYFGLGVSKYKRFAFETSYLKSFAF